MSLRKIGLPARSPRQKLLLFFRRDSHPVDFIRDINLTGAFRGIRVVAGIGGLSGRLVQFHEGGEDFAVLALHPLHEDGLARVQVLDLLLCQFHASQRLPVEELVVLEDVLDAPALGVDLYEGVELVAGFGRHALDIDFLAFPQVVLFLFGQFHPLYLVRDEHVVHFGGHHLIGKPVYADEGRDVFPVAPLQFHDTPHVARLQQVALVLVGEDVPEIRAVEVGLLADSVDAQHDFPVS